MRYYVQVSPFILPVVTDRPLVMKRYPDGVRSEAFYQHRAPDKVPSGVRIEVLPDDDVPSRPVGGTLKTLLYLTQLAAISQDPWFSRVQSLHVHRPHRLRSRPDAGHVVRDRARRRPLAARRAGEGRRGGRAEDVGLRRPARVRPDAEADDRTRQGASGRRSSRRSWQPGIPQVATVERSVKRRGAKVYVDYLQNIEGKTLACAYSGRASEFAGASTPLTWDEVDAGVDRRDFTIRTLPARLAEVGDLWKALWKVKPPDLRKVERHLRVRREHTITMARRREGAMDLQLIAVDPRETDAQRLLAELTAEIAAIYADKGQDGTGGFALTDLDGAARGVRGGVRAKATRWDAGRCGRTMPTSPR